MPKTKEQAHTHWDMLLSQQCGAAQAEVLASEYRLTTEDIHVKSIFKSLKHISNVMMVTIMMILVINTKSVLISLNACGRSRSYLQSF